MLLVSLNPRATLRKLKLPRLSNRDFRCYENANRELAMGRVPFYIQQVNAWKEDFRSRNTIQAVPHWTLNVLKKNPNKPHSYQTAMMNLFNY